MTVERVGRMLAVLLVATAVALGILAATWRADGGRWQRVETPSMGTAAPVGTLLWTKPADIAELEVGDLISFHPPNDRGVTYSHRVLRRHADGTVATEGVLSGPDPWRLEQQDLVGVVRMRWWGVGWLVAAAPILVVGGFLVAAARRLVSHHRRLALTLVLGALVFDVAVLWWRPFIDAEQLSFVPVRGGAEATYVGTGLLPVRLTAHRGPSAVMRAGEVGTVRVSKLDRHGRWQVRLSPAVPLWFWVLLVAVCFVPALCTLAAPREELGPARHATSGEQPA